MREIQELNGSFDGFRIFAGVECDILKDGTLDFDDAVLAQLDFVVASVHSSFTLSKSQMTDRIIRAIRNPYVTMLGHATGRLLAGRDGYQLDLGAVIQAAAESGTIIELNCSPQRMELDWRWWHMARDLGVKCSINTDAHRLEGLGVIWHGVQAARKGWLRREDVINCQPLGVIEKTLAAKRPADS
jgi:DNA polymerase (family 10)